MRAKPELPRTKGPKRHGRAKHAATLAGILSLAVVLGSAACSQQDGTTESSRSGDTAEAVIIHTNRGDITVELFAEKAPETVANFLAYVDDGFYDGTLFHRVIKNFMIQGGGYDSSRQLRPTREPVRNEAANGLKNDTGMIAMARTNDPHSATSQFFINVKQNTFLDYKSEDSGQSWGYAVFGQVIDGMDVVRVIEHSPTGDEGGAFRDMPVEPVIIEGIERR